jgi:hypothetical protein
VSYGIAYWAALYLLNTGLYPYLEKFKLVAFYLTDERSRVQIIGGALFIFAYLCPL